MNAAVHPALRVAAPLILLCTLLASCGGGSSAAGIAPPDGHGPAPVGTARLLYTDVDSGPATGGKDDKGAFVTIWGKGFGSSQGTSTVTVGGGAVGTYVEWSDTKIVVQLGSESRSGDIVVSNSFGNSNGLPFTVRTGPVYFVSLTGTGNGSFASPMAPSSIYGAIAPGATFYFRGGTYSGMYGVTSWSDFNFVLGGSKKGTAGNPVAFVAYPGEAVTFSGHNGAFSMRDSYGAPADYLTIAGFRFYCQSMCVHGGANTSAGAEVAKSGGRNIRLVGNVMSASYSNNTMTGVITVGADGWRVYGNEIKDTGTTPPINNNHGIYIQVGASDVDVGWNYLHDLRMGHVIQVHTDTAFLYENVRIHDNVISAANPGDSRGINVGNALGGSNGSIYNNVLYNLGQDFSAIAIYSGNWNILNNTLYNVRASAGMVWLNSQSARPTAVIRNNIFYSDGSSPYIGMMNGTTSSQFTISNNLYFNGSSVPGSDSAAVKRNPLFVNPAAGNFRLQTTSPAIDKGSSAAATIVSRDIEGNSRTLNSPIDIGAHEAVR